MLVIASKDKENNIGVLKQFLKENGFKLCSDSAMIALSEASDLGLDEEARLYWESIALLHLPAHPHQALKD